MVSDVIFSCSDMAGLTDAADRAARGDYSNPFKSAIGAFVGGEVANWVAGFVLGVTSRAGVVGTMVTIC
jgi:hypothetical protein